MDGTQDEKYNMKPYTLRKSKGAKHLRLRIYGDGRVVMTAPWWLGGQVIEKFFQDKSGWVREKLDALQHIQPQAASKFDRQDYLAQKEAARALVEERIASYNAIYGFPLNRISIRHQKTRWGSCSSQKNVSINYKIIYLPRAMQDYLIVHELCHLRELNHSPRFWALVAQTIPNYRALKRALRQAEKLYR